MFQKFLPVQRTIIETRRKSEAVFDKDFFSGPVAVEHAPHLRERNMRFVDNH